MFEFSVRIKKYIISKIKQKSIIYILKEPICKTKEIIKSCNLLRVFKNIPIESYSIMRIIEFSPFFNSDFLNLQQHKYEIAKLLEIINKHKLKNILEIGTFFGGTLFLFSRVIDKNALIISIDLPIIKIGRLHLDWKVPIIKQVSLPHQKLKLIRDDSHNVSTLNKIKRILKGKKLDFLFIDADHSYKGIKKDFELYAPLVRKGGIIAFHDIVTSPYGVIGTVHQFWEEIKNQFKFKEIIENINKTTGGIGVIEKK